MCKQQNPNFPYFLRVTGIRVLRDFGGRALVVQAHYRCALIVSILPKTRENSQRLRTKNATSSQQLALLAPPKEKAIAPAAIPKSIRAKLAPGCHHRSNADRYWLVCGFDGRPFGGLYYRSEIDHILEHFEGWRGPITPATFGIVAERAIQFRNKQMGVAS